MQIFKDGKNGVKWNKKGIKNASDVEKNRSQYKEKKEEKLEVFEYNWLEDDE